MKSTIKIDFVVDTPPRVRAQSLMSWKWTEYLVSLSRKGKGNIIEVSGAVLLLLSFVLPWFRGHYRLSTTQLYGGQMLLDAAYKRSSVPAYALVLLLFLLFVALYALVSARGRGMRLLSLLGIGLLAGIPLALPYSLDKLAIGVYAALAGLLLLLLGPLAKRA